MEDLDAIKLDNEETTADKNDNFRKIEEVEKVEDETENGNKPHLAEISHPRSDSPAVSSGNTCSQRVYKKSSPNNKLSIYLYSRDLSISEKEPDRLRGVLVIDPEYLGSKKVYGQITLNFRYGREDEEVMGLKFCNEAVMSLAQLYPRHEQAPIETNSPVQETLIRRLGPHAHPFSLSMVNVAPPSVQLVPAKEYRGAPIGTSYDIRVFAADRPDEKLNRRSMVRMGIRVVQRATLYSAQSESPSVMTSLVSTSGGESRVFERKTSEPPRAAVEKPFLLSEGRVELEASLDKAIYHHGDPVLVNVNIQNNSGKTVRRIKVFIVQHVDVCMFSNGKFKNVVALLNCKKDVPILPRKIFKRTYELNPAKGTTKNWIALEDSLSKGGPCLASTVAPPASNPYDRNVFAIYVSYYVKVKILVGAMGGELSLKLPFTLIHAPQEDIKLPLIAPEMPPVSMENTENSVKVELHESKECRFQLQPNLPERSQNEDITAENKVELL